MTEITLVLTIKPHPAADADSVKGLASFAGSETQRLCDYLHERGHVATFEVETSGLPAPEKAGE